MYTCVSMIDWVTAKLPLLHPPINAGRTVRFCENGAIEWQVPHRKVVRGSYDGAIQISSDGASDGGMAQYLRFDGNPAKFLQGHNLFGSDDLVSLVLACFDRICAQLGLQPSEQERAVIAVGDYTVSRIDFTHSFELRNRSDVRAWIRAAEFKAKSRHGRPSMKHSTLYFGQHSRFWSWKFYAKGDEIADRGHQLPQDIPHHDLLSSWADNKLRSEACFRQMFLKRYEIERAASLTPERLNSLYCDYLSRLDMNEQVALSSEELFKLPKRLHMVYSAWRGGEDLRSMLSRPTFYRYRKQLLEHGIDITIRRDHSDSSNVVPLIRVLEAKPADVPQWAVDKGLVFIPRVA